jgi:hypothetical protein
MRHFDIDAAMRGDRFIHELHADKGGTTGKDATFVGFRGNGSIVYETSDGEISWAPRKSLRMCAEKKTVYVNVYECYTEDSNARDAGAFDTEQQARDNAESNRMRVLATAIPIEIEV